MLIAPWYKASPKAYTPPVGEASQYPSPVGDGAIALTVVVWPSLSREPWNAASPKLNTPPSAAANQ